MAKPKVEKIHFRKILHSKGGWTIEGEVEIAGKGKVIASIPHGTSTGKREARYLPVEKAVEVCQELQKDFVEYLDSSPKDWDYYLKEKDGTPNKEKLGGNSILLLSLLFWKTKAFLENLPLFSYISQLQKTTPSFPRVGFLVFEGGLHAHQGPDWQEFLFVPSERVPSKLIENLRALERELRAEIEKHNYKGVNFGLEGGRVITEKNNTKLLDLLLRAQEKAGVEGEIFIDMAASHLFQKDKYHSDSQEYTIKEWQERVIRLFKEYPSLRAIEDPFSEEDLQSWQETALKKEKRFVGDDLTVTNPELIERFASQGYIEGVVIKPNQIGTVSETLEAIKKAKEYNLFLVTKHRSCETLDTFIVDLAVATNSEFLMIGGLKGGERVAKYNRLLEIEELFS